MTSKKSDTRLKPTDKLLPKLTLGFFDRPRKTALIWLVLVVFGALSYTTLLKREGFPPIDVPIAIVNGAYAVNDPTKVDSEISKPLSELALKDPDVVTAQATSADNFFNVVLQYKEGVDARAATEAFKQKVSAEGILPTGVKAEFNTPYFGATGGDTQKIDIAVALYDKTGKASTEQLLAKANQAVVYLNALKIDQVESVSLKNPYSEIINPATGQKAKIQQNFDRFGVRANNDNQFYNSITLTFAATKDKDVIQLDGNVRQALDKLTDDSNFSDYGAAVSASYAPSINESINELQKVLLEGLIAVLVIGSIVIAVRASVITILSMITVILSTIALLYLIGYTLNVITLFGLILGLSLIVDDTIIMVEAIDAARKRGTDRREIIREATRKISRAMVAATTTAALSFAPLLFVSGILGSFIRAIPVTIISALLISLLVALIIIPLLARFILLGKDHLGSKVNDEIASGIEEKIARAISWPMRHAKNSRKKIASLTIAAVLVGLSFIGGGLVIAKSVTFNIFPASKDSDQIMVQLQFAPNTTLSDASKITAKADQIAASGLSENFVKASYYSTASAQSAMITIDLVPYGKRDIKAPELVSRLQDLYNQNLPGTVAKVNQVDNGPPASSFIVQVAADNREASIRLAADISAYLKTAELSRLDGSKAYFTSPTVSSTDLITRSNGKAVLTVSAGFDDTDTTTLVTLAQAAVNDHFNEAKLAGYGLAKNTISFDLGQESENQDSFKALAIAFPLVLLVIYLLLVLEFRSLLQPLLIFTAIPFSIFGVMLGLKLTDNAISFFSMLGFFALIGLSIKNTILLTDYANQSRRNGMDAIDAVTAAIHERFRPLFATSVTAIVSLIPLAITSPFWQGLAVVLMFGLASSTFLVLTVFPYFYLIVESIRDSIKSRLPSRLRRRLKT